MLISIITPAFRAQRYIGDCIASVKHALDGLDYEHIIVDGASDDETVPLLKTLAHPRLRWISEPDKGMYDALNKGIAMAKGTIIGHLNSDEQYSRKGTQQAISALTTHSAFDAVFGPTIMVDEHRNFLQLFNQIVVPSIADTYWCMPVQSCSLFFRKQCWEKIPFDASLRLVADHRWFSQQMEAGMRLNAVCTPIGIFTWHPACLSNTRGNTHPEEAIPVHLKRSMRTAFTKRLYRLKKIFQGGYSRHPLDYTLHVNGTLEQRTEDKPALKIKRKRFKVHVGD